MNFQLSDMEALAVQVLSNLKSIKCKNDIFDSYLISEDGQIYSKYKKDFMKIKTDKDGYYIIKLYSSLSGKQKDLRIANLVAYNFIEFPSNLEDPTVNHKDGNIKNNHFSNLEWIQRSENSSIRKNKGQGILNHEAKLTEEEVIKIRKEHSSTMSYLKLANKYGVSKSCIASIIQRKTWKSTGV